MQTQAQRERTNESTQANLLQRTLQDGSEDGVGQRLIRCIKDGSVGLGKALPASIILQRADLIYVCEQELTTRGAASIVATCVKRSVFSIYCAEISRLIAGEYEENNSIARLPRNVCAAIFSFLDIDHQIMGRALCRSLYICATNVIGSRSLPCDLLLTPVGSSVKTKVSQKDSAALLLMYLFGSTTSRAATASDAFKLCVPANPGLSVVLPMTRILIEVGRSALGDNPFQVSQLSAEWKLRFEGVHEDLERFLLEVVLRNWEEQAESHARGVKRGGVFRDARVDVVESLLQFLETDFVRRNIVENVEDDEGVTDGFPTESSSWCYAHDPLRFEKFPIKIIERLLKRAFPLILPVFNNDLLLTEDDAEYINEGRMCLFAWICALRVTSSLEKVFAVDGWRSEIEANPERWISEMFDVSVERRGAKYNTLLNVSILTGAERLARHLLEHCSVSLSLPDSQGCLPLHYLFRPSCLPFTITIFSSILPLLSAKTLLLKTRTEEPVILLLLDTMLAEESCAEEVFALLCEANMVRGALPLYWCLKAMHVVKGGVKAGAVEGLCARLIDAGCNDAGLGRAIPDYLPTSLLDIARTCSEDSCMEHAPDSDLGSAHCCALSNVEKIRAQILTLPECPSDDDASVPDNWEEEV